MMYNDISKRGLNLFFCGCLGRVFVYACLFLDCYFFSKHLIT
jgi:hypothetical protein